MVVGTDETVGVVAEGRRSGERLASSAIAPRHGGPTNESPATDDIVGTIGHASAAISSMDVGMVSQRTAMAMGYVSN